MPYSASSPSGPSRVPAPATTEPAFPSRASLDPTGPRRAAALDRRAPSQIPLHEALPEIGWLPSHTNVIMIAGEPKQPPWTIRDIAPRHQLRPDFELLPLDDQRLLVDREGYLPYDIYGNPVLTRFPPLSGGPKAVHVFRDDPRWEDVIVDSVRTDDPFLPRFTTAAPERPSASRDGAAAAGFTAMNK